MVVGMIASLFFLLEIPATWLNSALQVLYSKTAMLTGIWLTQKKKKRVSPLMALLIREVDPSCSEWLSPNPTIPIAEKIEEMVSEYAIVKSGSVSIPAIEKLVADANQFARLGYQLCRKAREFSLDFPASDEKKELLLAMEIIPQKCAALWSLANADIFGMSGTVEHTQAIFMEAETLVRDIVQSIIDAFLSACKVCRALKAKRDELRMRNSMLQDESYYDTLHDIFEPPTETHSALIAAFSDEDWRLQNFFKAHAVCFTPLEQEILTTRHTKQPFNVRSIPEDVAALCLKTIRYAVMPNDRQSKCYDGKKDAIDCLLHHVILHSALSSSDTYDIIPSRPEIANYPHMIDFCAKIDERLNRKKTT